MRLLRLLAACALLVAAAAADADAAARAESARRSVVLQASEVVNSDGEDYCRVSCEGEGCLPGWQPPTVARSDGPPLTNAYLVAPAATDLRVLVVWSSATAAGGVRGPVTAAGLAPNATLWWPPRGAALAADFSEFSAACRPPTPPGAAPSPSPCALARVPVPVPAVAAGTVIDFSAGPSAGACASLRVEVVSTLGDAVPAETLTVAPPAAGCDPGTPATLCPCSVYGAALPVALRKGVTSVITLAPPPADPAGGAPLGTLPSGLGGPRGVGPPPAWARAVVLGGGVAGATPRTRVYVSPPADAADGAVLGVDVSVGRGPPAADRPTPALGGPAVAGGPPRPGVGVAPPSTAAFADAVCATHAPVEAYVGVPPVAPAGANDGNAGPGGPGPGPDPAPLPPVVADQPPPTLGPVVDGSTPTASATPPPPPPPPVAVDPVPIPVETPPQTTAPPAPVATETPAPTTPAPTTPAPTPAVTETPAPPATTTPPATTLPPQPPATTTPPATTLPPPPVVTETPPPPETTTPPATTQAPSPPPTVAPPPPVIQPPVTAPPATTTPPATTVAPPPVETVPVVTVPATQPPETTAPPETSPPVTTTPPETLAPPPAPSTPPATQAPPPQTLPPPTPAPLCPSTTALWGQCGGRGGACTSGSSKDCKDEAWAAACCGDGAECVRVNEWWWKCAPGSPAPAPAPSSCARTVPLYSQCGGVAGNGCPTGRCADAPWQGTCCGSGATCTRYNEWFWQCERDASCGRAGARDAAGRTLVADWGQCGGRSGCQGSNCDGAWDGVACCAGAVCKPVSPPWYSQCVPA